MLQRIKEINWKSGASTALLYIVVMWIIALAFIFFVEMYLAFSGSSENQLYADILADGTAFIGNTGWGLDLDEADDAFNTLVELNTGEATDCEFDDVTSQSPSYLYTNSLGKTQVGVRTDAHNNAIKNTVKATAKSESSLITVDDSWDKSSTATTRITYSGGMRIVYEAWLHTYQYLAPRGMEEYQTEYVWGGGHGDNNWESQADCSGFVSGVYRKCGYDVPNWACTWNMQTMGEEIYDGSYVGGDIVFADAMPGDIILYWWSSASGVSSHVAIYAGEYNGVYYQVHSSGGTANTASNPNSGIDGGAILTPVSTHPARIMVRRLVDSTATVYETPEITLPNCTDDETTTAILLSMEGYSKTTIAAILGNFRREGAGYANMVQGHYHNTEYDKKFNEEYTWKVNNGIISMNEFINDKTGGGGYGMAQWTDKSRKQGLYQKCGGTPNSTENLDIGNVNLQVAYLDYELKNIPDYTEAYNKMQKTTDVNEATKIFFEDYERPGDNSLSLRQGYAKMFLNDLNLYPDIFG